MLERLFGKGQSRLIEAAYRDIEEMLTQSARMLDLASAAFLDNQPLEVDLDRMDDTVDENERLIRRSVLEHLAVNPSQDLVASLLLASICQDAERIGDFARGLGELIPLAKSRRQGKFRDGLKEILAELRPQFDVCIRAFREDNLEEAKQVMAHHLDFKRRLDELTRAIAESDLSADLAVVYSAAARILRRISAHLSNIASSVVQPYDKIRKDDEAD